MTYPIVIPLHHRGGKFRNNTELRFALRSLARHFKDDCEIAIVGSRLPEWAKGLKHIESRSGLKTALADAAKVYPEGFFWWYDDLCLLKDMTGEEMKVTPACRGWGKPRTGWSRRLDEIRQRLVKEGRPVWDYSRPHGPYWFDQGMVEEGFADWPGMAAKFPWESWILSKRDWPRRHGVVKQYYGGFRGEPGLNACFLNYNDKGNTLELRRWLGQRFQNECEWETELLERDAWNMAVSEPKRNMAVSFCLFGNDPRYVAGLLDNARLAPKYYPDWEVVTFVEKGHEIIPALRREGCRVIEKESEPGLRGTLWRFEAFADTTYERVICRDADCRLGWKERAAVEDWIRQDTILHTMWDRKRRRSRHISAGMFGMKTGLFPIGKELAAWEATGKYGDDENFLNQRVWPVICGSLTAHCRGRRAAGEIPFPPHAPDGFYVGEVHPGVRPAPETVRIYRICRPELAQTGDVVVAPVVGAGHRMGNTCAHVMAASRALADGIFPCIVLEEDAAWLPTDGIDLKSVDDCWLWIGISKFRLDKKGTGRINISPVLANDGVFEMGNMCATHGIAFLTAEGARRMAECAVTAAVRNLPIDVGVIQTCHERKWPRPGLISPWVYQRGRNEGATLFKVPVNVETT